MRPNNFALTRAYFEKQIARTIAVIERIRNRNPVLTGRVIPDDDSLAIHDARRITATVLFLDISKFSQRLSSTAEEQENLLVALSLFFTEMIKIIEDYDGRVEKNTGDGLMAYFMQELGDTEPPQQKALAAALTMFHAGRTIINPVLQQSGILPFNFRICIDHGPITVAKVGAVRGFNGIVAIGTPANIASKMLSYAEADTILLGTDVLAGLPAEWKNRFIRLKTLDTGWTYTLTGAPYAFWEYEGRWTEPT